MNTKTKKAKKYALPFIAIMAVLLAFGSPAAADYSGDKPLTIYEQDTINGGLIFVTDETGGNYTKLYSDPDPDFGMPGSMTQNISIEIPEGATVKTARLYNTYCWSTSNDNDPYVPGLPAQARLTFSDGTTTVTQICDHGFPGLDEPEEIKNVPNPIYCDDCVHYWDTKNASNYPPPLPQGWDYPSGEFAWNVTGMVTGSGTYNATIENIEMEMGYTPTENERFVTFGFGLLVVYEHTDSPLIEYWIAEGCDSLLHNKGAGAGNIWETWENATSYTTFSGVSSATAEDATLTTVLTCSQGGLLVPPTNMICFNCPMSCVECIGPDDPSDCCLGPSTAAGDEHYGVNYFNVATLTGDNVVGFQDRGDCEYLHNAFLVVEALDYKICGYTDPAADKVNFTNLNKSEVVEDRPADYIDPVTGFYNLTLNVPDEVETGDVLRIIACDAPTEYESNCNVTDHTVVNAPGEDTNVNLTLNHYCKNYYPTFPFHTWNESNWSGPAVMEMLIDNYRDTSDVPNQTVLNATGLGYNQGCNADLLYVDPLGMKSTLNLYLHAYGGLPYVANYGVGRYDTLEDVLHYMCKWHYLGPGAAPAYGNYSNWMVVRGIHTNTTPSFTQGSYEIYGFWINDPYNATLEGPGGIGENTYKTVNQWSSIYHKKLNESGVNTSDYYYDKYVAVCEPPEDDDVVVTLAQAKPRFAIVITPAQMEKPLMVYEVEQLALEKVVTNDESLKIVKAAIDGVTEELIPYDAEFAEVFAKTTAGAPMLVTDDSGDYYVVPFNVPVEVRPPVKIMPVKIEKVKISGLKELEQVKRVDEYVIIEPIQIEPIEVERTLVVVLVDATDGSFKEASWVADAVKYLPVSKVEALKLALTEIDITSANELSNLSSKPTIELVYRNASPYYPDWKIAVDGSVYYVSQDGTVSS